MNAVFTEMKRIDKAIAEKYYPNAETVEPTESQIPLWLAADIEDVVCKHGMNARQEILDMIQASACADEIMRYIDMKRIDRAVEIRSDFAEAFRSVKHGFELSGAIGYGLSRRDISALAFLHRANRFRSKIEDLLEDCNFHKENSDFQRHEYDAYLMKWGVDYRVGNTYTSKVVEAPTAELAIKRAKIKNIIALTEIPFTAES